MTTVAELFIGFLVAAASNRSERNLDRTLAGIGAQEQRIGDVEDKLTAALAENTALTQAIHDLTAEVHRAVFPAPVPSPAGSAGTAGPKPGGAGKAGAPVT